MINAIGVYYMEHFKEIYKELDFSFKEYTNVDAVDNNNNVINHRDDFANMIIRDIPDYIKFIKGYQLE
jgi:succinylglutamate desuccinylase